AWHWRSACQEVRGRGRAHGGRGGHRRRERPYLGGRDRWLRRTCRRDARGRCAAVGGGDDPEVRGDRSFLLECRIFIDGGVNTPDADWKRILDVNVMAHICAARAVLPGMLAR